MNWKRIYSVLPALVLGLMVCACGKGGKIITSLHKSDKQQLITSPIRTGNNLPMDLADKELTDQCGALLGRLTPDLQMCLTRKIVDFNPEGETEQVIDASFEDGKFVVSTGSAASSAVDIVLNGKHLLNIPERKLGASGAGKLSFYVNAKSPGAVISAAVWTCFDRKLHRVFCNAAAIP